MSDEMNLDSDLEGALFDEATQANAGAKSATPNPTPEQVIEAGGRKFTSQAELAKAYGGLLKDYSRVQGEHSKYKPWMESWQSIQKYPDLYNDLNQRIAEYQKRLAAGQSPATAQRATNLPDPYVERMTSIESRIADRELKDEMNDLRTRFNVDPETLKEIVNTAYGYAQKGVGLSLEDAYWQIQGKKGAATARTEAEQQVKQELKTKQQSNVGPSTAGTVAPSPKAPNQMTRQERRAAILARFKSASQ